MPGCGCGAFRWQPSGGVWVLATSAAWWPYRRSLTRQARMTAAEGGKFPVVEGLAISAGCLVAVLLIMAFGKRAPATREVEEDASDQLARRQKLYLLFGVVIAVPVLAVLLLGRSSLREAWPILLLVALVGAFLVAADLIRRARKM